MNFEEYLRSKKVDSSAFKLKEKSKYNKLETLFDQIHPESFTAQKLFLLNPLRRKYTLKEKVETLKPKSIIKTKIAKPKI